MISSSDKNDTLHHHMPTNWKKNSYNGMFRSVAGVLEMITVDQRDHGHHWECVLEWVRANQRQMV